VTVCTHACISEPLSWFVLEQYHLGDLDSNAASETKRHLSSCPACADVYHHIEHDAVSLPDLPALIPTPRTASARSIPWKGIIPLVAAAALLLFVLNPPIGTDIPPPSHIVTKGGELALSLVRLRDDTVRENPDRFQSGDRFRLLLTSPFTDNTLAEVVVFQGKETFFPYSEGLTIDLGNQVPVDGAFILTGDEDAVVCVIADSPKSRLPSRRELAVKRFSALPPTSVCHTLFAVE
jgi:hypothetical protein